MNMPLTEQLLVVADEYCRLSSRSRARVSTLIFGDGMRLHGVANGKDIQTRNFERAMQWFSANWPEGVAWPAGIERPGTAAAGGGAGEREAV